MTIKQTKRMLKCQHANPSVNVYDGNRKQSHSSRKPKSNNIKIKSNVHSKTKIIVPGGSLVKYLRREELCKSYNTSRIYNRRRA